MLLPQFVSGWMQVRGEDAGNLPDARLRFRITPIGTDWPQTVKSTEEKYM